MSKFTAGDIIKDGDDDYVKILLVTDRHYVITDFEDSYADAAKATEPHSIKSDSYAYGNEWEVAQKVTEVTLEDVAEKFGIDIKELRIKE